MNLLRGSSKKISKILKKGFCMKKLCAFVMFCAFSTCCATGESLALAIEMKSVAHMQLALADMQVNEKIDGTVYMNQLADSWYAGTAWWKHAIACGASLAAAGRVVLGGATLDLFSAMNARAAVRHMSPAMGKQWFIGYGVAGTGWALISTGIGAGWYAWHRQLTRVHVDLARILLTSQAITIDQTKLTGRARVLLRLVH